MGNGDGSSSDSLNRHTIGQEDHDDDDEDEDSSEYENLVSEQFQSPHLTEPLGRPATLWPDGDAHSSSGSSWSSTLLMSKKGHKDGARH